jgi:hypothetical protein
MRRVALGLAVLLCAAGVDAQGRCPKFSRKYFFASYEGNRSGCRSTNGIRCFSTEEISYAVSAFGYDLRCGRHTFEWSFDDGTRATGRTVTKSFEDWRTSATATVVIRQRWSSARFRVVVPMNPPVP